MRRFFSHIYRITGLLPVAVVEGKPETGVNMPGDIGGQRLPLQFHMRCVVAKQVEMKASDMIIAPAA